MFAVWWKISRKIEFKSWLILNSPSVISLHTVCPVLLFWVKKHWQVLSLPSLLSCNSAVLTIFVLCIYNVSSKLVQEWYFWLSCLHITSKFNCYPNLGEVQSKRFHWRFLLLWIQCVIPFFWCVWGWGKTIPCNNIWYFNEIAQV